MLDAALELFGEQGVSGTSLQMIADRIGVTKAAVYHQFPSKEEIVMGVLAPALETLRESVEHAERQETAEGRREAMLTALVELTVGHRWLAAILQADPAVNAWCVDTPTTTSDRGSWHSSSAPRQTSGPPWRARWSVARC